MSDLFEILFDGIDSSKIKQLVKLLTKNGSNIDKVSFSQMENKDYSNDMRSLSFLDDMLTLSDPVVIIGIHLDSLAINETCIKKPVISVEKDSEIYSILILFYEDDIIMGKSGSATPDLIEFSKEVAEMLKAESYYAGLEPAEDEATRIFTGDVAGPYAL